MKNRKHNYSELRTAKLIPAANRLNFFNYILVITYVLWSSLNQYLQNGAFWTTQLIIEALAAFALCTCFTLAKNYVIRYNHTVLLLFSIITCLAYTAIIYLTIFRTGGIDSVFYFLFFILLIEMRHLLGKTGTIVAAVGIAVCYLALVAYNTSSWSHWLNSSIIFGPFLAYIVAYINDLLASEREQYLQQKEMEQLNANLQREKEIIDLLHSNIKDLSNSLDLSHIASKVVQLLHHILWHKKTVFAIVDYDKKVIQKYFKFHNDVAVTRPVSEKEQSVIIKCAQSGNIYMSPDMHAIPLKSFNQVVGVILLMEYNERTLKERYSLASAVCEQAAIVLRNAFMYYKKERESITDGMTGLYNHKHFQEYLSQCIAKDRGDLYLMMFDIDHFKKFNDTYGHAFGDTVLIETAHAVQRVLRSNDFFARYGGEEFAVVFQAPDDNVAYQIAERVLHAVREHKVYNEDLQQHISVTISIGLGRYKSGMSKNDFIDLVDQHLYKSKQNGRNQITMVEH